MEQFELTQQDITIAIGVMGLYLAWRSSHNLNKVLEGIQSQMPTI